MDLRVFYSKPQGNFTPLWNRPPPPHFNWEPSNTLLFTAVPKVQIIVKLNLIISYYGNPLLQPRKQSFTFHFYFFVQQLSQSKIFYFNHYFCVGLWMWTRYKILCFRLYLHSLFWRRDKSGAYPIPRWLVKTKQISSPVRLQPAHLFWTRGIDLETDNFLFRLQCSVH